MKAAVIQVWALLCLLISISYGLICDAAYGICDFFRECGIEMSYKNVTFGLLYSVCAYLFVISVWLVLM